MSIGGRLRNGIDYVQGNKTFIKSASFLNIAFLVSAMGDRLWMFAIGILMAEAGGMTWVAIHQLIDSSIKLILAPATGRWLDTKQRDRGMQLILGANNIAIGLSAVAFYLNLSTHEAGWNRSIYLALAIVFGGLSRVASDAQRTAFTKDWIVEIVSSGENALLSTQNTAMVMTEQFSGFVVPLLAGLMLDTMPKTSCCLLIIGWNILSWVVEASVLQWLHNNTPALKKKKDLTLSEPTEASCCQALSSYSTYGRQKCFRPAFGLALLFMTVLGFDNIAISYGASHGMSATALGVFRSAGSLLGFFGSLTYGVLSRTVGVLLTGLIGLMLQNVFISCSSVSSFLPGSPMNVTGYVDTLTFSQWSSEMENAIVGGGAVPDDLQQTMSIGEMSPHLFLFFFGITAARYGLWIADPSIAELMQTSIPENERYTVFGVQTALQELFSIMKDCLIIFFPAASIFGVFSIGSHAFVFTGFAFYLSYFFQEFRKSDTAPVERELEEVKLPEEHKLLDK